MQGRLMDGKVAILVLGIKDLVNGVCLLGSLEDVVNHLFVLVGAFCHNAHEGKLVHSDCLYSLSATKISHLISGDGQESFFKLQFRSLKKSVTSLLVFKWIN